MRQLAHVHLLDAHAVIKPNLDPSMMLGHSADIRVHQYLQHRPCVGFGCVDYAMARCIPTSPESFGACTIEDFMTAIGDPISSPQR
jgi:hypothetical protein